MKSYTDIEQSKRLAEILPLESADMYYDVDSSGVQTTPEVLIASVVRKKDIPCWSLPALLNVLPKGTRLLKSATDDTYHCDCPKGNIDKWYDSPIDACYEMILKLKGNNML